MYCGYNTWSHQENCHYKLSCNSYYQVLVLSSIAGQLTRLMAWYFDDNSTVELEAAMITVVVSGPVVALCWYKYMGEAQYL